MDKKIFKEYSMNNHFHELSLETQDLLRIIMTIIESAHLLDENDETCPKRILEIYSPENSLLNQKITITWGQAIHAVITDVILKRDILSQAPSMELRH